MFRAFGILGNARSISTDETVNLLSAVRLGVNAGLIEHLPLERVNEMFILTQPGHLQKSESHPLNPSKRDVARAEFIRKRIG